jgi:rSAM/selenodomain-associated transferase 1
MKSVRNHLILFLRAPQIGAVKGRLADGVGAYAAWRFYRQTSARLITKVAGDHRWSSHLAVTSATFVTRSRFWPDCIRRFDQGQGDIGQRMAASFAATPLGAAVLVGGDIPDLGRDHIASAFQALRQSEIVFGPASDGGFWLVGLSGRRIPKEVMARRLFRDVRWSGPQALEDTARNIPAHVQVRYLETLDDVDHAADLEAARGRE